MHHIVQFGSGLTYELYIAYYFSKQGYAIYWPLQTQSRCDLVIAFPGGKGTKMMVELARKAGVEVIEVQYTGL